MDGSSLYDDDFVTWSEQQAEALRALARSRPELSNVVDWENVIEEIETLGRSEWRGVESLLHQALAHILKGYCDPDSLSRIAWSVETRAFLDAARADFRNSMRRRIDMDKIWRDAFRSASQEMLAYKRRVPPGIPSVSPFALDDLLQESFTYEEALRHLYARLDAPH
jgi:hypothetical protein